MDVTWIDGYCLAKPGVTRDYKAEWSATRYMIDGKMFAMDGGDKEGVPILTVKLEPLYSELLRREHPGVIVPGYYMNKEHWSSVYYRGEPPRELLCRMLDQAYERVLAGLPLKTRRQIENSGAGS